MFEKFMTEGVTTPYMMALCRASLDVRAGVLSLNEAANIYNVDPEIINQFNTDLVGYDIIQKNRG